MWCSKPREWSSQHPGLALNQYSPYSTQEAEKVPEEEPLHTIISDTENVQGDENMHAMDHSEVWSYHKLLLELISMITP